MKYTRITVNVDNPLSPKVSLALGKAGYDAVHVRDYDMQSASDEEILKRALSERRTIISADTDFGYLLFSQQIKEISFILF